MQMLCNIVKHRNKPPLVGLKSHKTAHLGVSGELAGVQRSLRVEFPSSLFCVPDLNSFFFNLIPIALCTVSDQQP